MMLLCRRRPWYCMVRVSPVAVDIHGIVFGAIVCVAICLDEESSPDMLSNKMLDGYTCKFFALQILNVKKIVNKY